MGLKRWDGRRRRAITAVIATGAILLAGGCVRGPVRPPAPDPITVQLADSAASVAQAWQHTNQVVTAANAPAAAKIEPAPVHWPKGLEKPIDMRWVGPLLPAIKALAAAGGWKARSLGSPLGTDLMITLSGVDQSIGEWLRAAGIQAGQRADVVLQPDDKQVLVIYRESNDRNGSATK